ncbi:MAG: hypothetical protein H7Y16_10115 [Candidatus Parcubacteria bacterium]|nr:hypothetical protein [Burkholderiales bacterium]
MVYLQLTAEVPRGKVQEIWAYYRDKIMAYDKACVEKVGGKYIGYWQTEYPTEGEITIMVAYEKIEDREKLMKLMFGTKDEKFHKEYEVWAAYTPRRTVKVMHPFPESPLR